MTTIAMNYIVNPFAGLFKNIKYGFELRGMIRAAAELRRLGYEKEYRMLSDRIREMRAER